MRHKATCCDHLTRCFSVTLHDASFSRSAFSSPDVHSSLFFSTARLCVFFVSSHALCEFQRLFSVLGLVLRSYTNEESLLSKPREKVSIAACCLLRSSHNEIGLGHKRPRNSEIQRRKRAKDKNEVNVNAISMLP
jgi:hypothetical protein